jgi:predicted amidohydrolase YtcJ
MGNSFTRRKFLAVGAAAGATCIASRHAGAQESGAPAELILTNGRISTLDRRRPAASSVAIRGGRFIAVGDDAEIMRQRGEKTQVIDLKKRTAIPGLNDSHLHLIRGGLNYNMELRWEGVPSLADALRMLKEQAHRTPPPQWVRVVGGWSEYQFAERRLPTLAEVNNAAPDTPVFILHLYDRALLNKAALRAVGYTKDTPDPPGGEIQRDKSGTPTGLLIARPNATILYSTLAKGPKLPLEHQANSTRQFMRELNRLGITSAIDAGGGFQNYPDDYRIIEELHRRGEMSVRLSYNLFTQRPKQEFDDFSKWIRMIRPGDGDDFYRMNGAGEMLTFSAADFEDFLEPRPELAAGMEVELNRVVRLLVEHRWPFRLHATYDESISRFLEVFEQINREIPFDGLRWFFDHAETISAANIERVKALGGGIAVQHRMAYQGEYFINRYGAEAAAHTPPITTMLKSGIPVGAGTDATRVASYNPWVSLYWLVAGKTVGGTRIYPASNCLDRTEALRRFTTGSAWFSGEEMKKGAIVPGQLADLAVLSADYFSAPEEEIKAIESELTVVGGRVVYAGGGLARYAPPPIPVLPDWSPVAAGGRSSPSSQASSCAMNAPHPINRHSKGQLSGLAARKALAANQLFWGAGCDCFAF